MMSAAYDEVLHKAQELPDNDRLKLIDALSTKHHGFATKELADICIAEAYDRLEAVNNGELEEVDMDQAMDEIQRKLNAG